MDLHPPALPPSLFSSILLASLHCICILLVFPSALNLKMLREKIRDNVLTNFSSTTSATFSSQVHHSSLAALGPLRSICIYNNAHSVFFFMQMDIFPYSVFYIFFEQYLDIWRIALINIAIALGECL